MGQRPDDFGIRNISYISTTDEALVVVTNLVHERVKVVGVALEGQKLGPNPVLSLVQVATLEGRVFVFDVLECPEILENNVLLQRLFKKPTTMKVMHNSALFYISICSAGCDVLKKVFDTQCAYMVVQSRYRNVSPYSVNPITIESLCEHYGNPVPGSAAAFVLNVQHSRPLYTRRWLDRPLPEDLLCLAAAHAGCLVPDTYCYFLSNIPMRERKVFYQMCDLECVYFLTPEDVQQKRVVIEGAFVVKRQATTTLKIFKPPAAVCIPSAKSRRTAPEQNLVLPRLSQAHPVENLQSSDTSSSSNGRSSSSEHLSEREGQEHNENFTPVLVPSELFAQIPKICAPPMIAQLQGKTITKKRIMDNNCHPTPKRCRQDSCRSPVRNVQNCYLPVSNVPHEEIATQTDASIQGNCCICCNCCPPVPNVPHGEIATQTGGRLRGAPPNDGPIQNAIVTDNENHLLPNEVPHNGDWIGYNRNYVRLGRSTQTEGNSEHPPTPANSRISICPICRRTEIPQNCLFCG